MNSGLETRVGLNWPLWTSAALAVLGGLAPTAVGGASSRISFVWVPFGIAAVAFALSAALKLGRVAVQIVFFVAGLAIIYGLLAVFSVAIRLALIGTCPAPPDSCTTGLPLALSDGETLGIASASAFGVVALLIGFLGLIRLVRRPVFEPYVPPVRKIPPLEPAPEPHAEPTPATVAAAAEAEPELPAPEELPELPAHESSTATS